jgi:anaerobic ribonucleoside-triphosphate reductase activating protein
MKIASTQYTLQNKAFEVYFSGCGRKPKCKNCCNKEIQSFDAGKEWDESYLSEMKNKIIRFSPLIDNIMIFGGEPLDQKHDEFIDFLNNISELNKKIWVFTSYELNEVPVDILNKIDYIKTGRYIEEMKSSDNDQYGIFLATTNQNIYKKGKDF